MSNKEKQIFNVPDEICPEMFAQTTMHLHGKASAGIMKEDIAVRVRTFEEMQNHLEKLIEFANQQVDIMHGLNDFQKMQYHLGQLHTAKDLLQIIKGAKYD